MSPTYLPVSTSPPSIRVSTPAPTYLPPYGQEIQQLSQAPVTYASSTASAMSSNAVKIIGPVGPTVNNYGASNAASFASSSASSPTYDYSTARPTTIGYNYPTPAPPASYPAPAPPPSYLAPAPPPSYPTPAPPPSYPAPASPPSYPAPAPPPSYPAPASTLTSKYSYSPISRPSYSVSAPPRSYHVAPRPGPRYLPPVS